jgi:DNA/RNA-binding domain of Phe-tRNA-synthetase-like protein
MTEVNDFTPTVAPGIWELRPDFVALSIVVRNGVNAASVEAVPIEVSQSAAWAEQHLESWRAAYRAFGAKPQRTPCSAEALRRRMERDGAPPRVNAIVDLYNAISLRYAVPVGGEDVTAYVGSPQLVRASGSELFQTIRDGNLVEEQVEAGEVIWRDDAGVTCRRWNWRQTPRTRLDIDTTDMWFVLERLEPMPMDALREAGEQLVAGLRGLAPDAIVRTVVIRAV